MQLSRNLSPERLRRYGQEDRTEPWPGTTNGSAGRWRQGSGSRPTNGRNVPLHKSAHPVTALNEPVSMRPIVGTDNLAEEFPDLFPRASECLLPLGRGPEASAARFTVTFLPGSEVALFLQAIQQWVQRAWTNPIPCRASSSCPTHACGRQNEACV